MSLTPYVELSSELRERVKKRLRYEKLRASISWWYLPSVALCFLIEIMAGMSESEIKRWGFLLPLFAPMVLVSLILWHSERRIKEYPVESDEWARFYASLIIKELDSYREAKSSHIKKGSRKLVLEKAKDFLSCVENRWTIGSFILVKQFVGNSLQDFEKNLRYRIIPVIKDGDDALLTKVSGIMYNLFHYSEHLTIERIQLLNEQMSKNEATQLPNREPLEERRLTRFLAFWKTHKFLKHCVVIIGFASVSFVLGYVGYTCAKVPIEYSWMGGITLFGVLFGTYFAKQPRSEK